MNIDTRTVGDGRLGILDERGNSIPGFGVENCDRIKGNDVSRPVSWRGKDDAGRLAGRPVRLEARLLAAKLYSFRFD